MFLVMSFLSLGFSFNSSMSVQEIIVTCNACHGQSGISSNPLWPNLAGQQQVYLVKQLKDYRDEIRKDPLMNPLSKNLSDEEIESLASYYANLKGSADE